MRPVEITEPLELSEREKALCAMHSFCNVLAVISTEIQFLRKALGDPGLFPRALPACETLGASFCDVGAAEKTLDAAPDFSAVLLEELEAALAKGTVTEPRIRKMVDEATENLRGILDVVEVRLQELRARRNLRGAWIALPAETIAEGLRQVFRAIARNSHGRYGIVFDPAEQGESDYLIEIDIRPHGGPDLFLPPELVDNTRDIAANARKYSQPGQKIFVQMVDTGKSVEVTVRDEGRGIPAEEISRIVRFGYRAANVRLEETKGGGFGLTKAYFVCRQHGGRMWIASETGRGTTVTLNLPRPA